MHNPVNRSSACGTTGKLSVEEKQVLHEAKTLYRAGQFLAAEKLALGAGLYEPFARWRDRLELKREEERLARIKRENFARDSDLPLNQIDAIMKIGPFRSKVTCDNYSQVTFDFA